MAETSEKCSVNDDPETEPLINTSVHGRLTILTAAVFITGEIAGSGVLALPKAVDDAGWMGLILIVACSLLSAYTGNILGRAWCLVQDRYEEYKGHVRYPYPALGLITFGKPGRYLVSFSINFTLFGVSVVFLLLASENIQDLIKKLGPDISFCYWVFLVAGVLTPFCWLGTPSDFWFAAVGATTATSIACVILTGNIIYDKQYNPVVEHSKPGFESFFTAFGTICFAFGGHPAFPTFQTDMKKPSDFGKAVLLAYTIVLAMYFPVSTGGYFVYGNTVDSNVLKGVSSGPALYIVEILITMHLIFGFIIVINPFSQEMEEFVGIPKQFTWKRCVTRTLIVGLVLFVAESIPRFGAILALVGGSTTTLLAYILPSLFYLKLCRMPGPWKEEVVPFHIKVMNYEIILVGLVAGIASTYSAISALADPNAFTPPCYINITAAKG